MGLLVIDEAHNFAPSMRTTPCKEGIIALVRQARKYGLGVLFATQEPKAIDNKIIANCMTQLFGRTNSPAALEAVREMLASRGGAVQDLGRLERGEFYLTTEGQTRAEKIRASLCLTYHPSSPPPEDDIVRRGAESRARSRG